MFFNQKKEINTVEIISRTLFFTSLISFFCFLFLDLINTGFVSRTFSILWFLLAAVISGIWWGAIVKEIKEQRFWQFFSAAIFAIFGVILTWQFRADLSDSLVLIIPLVLLTPFVVIWLVREV